MSSLESMGIEAKKAAKSISASIFRSKKQPFRRPCSPVIKFSREDT